MLAEHDQAAADNRLGVAGVDIVAALRAHDAHIGPMATRLTPD
jgi:hypothetical protein